MYIVYDNCKLIVTCTVSRENPSFQMQFSNFNNFLLNGSYQAYDVELGSDNPLVRYFIFNIVIMVEGGEPRTFLEGGF